MTAEDILMLDNEVKFLVELKRVAQRSGNKSLEAAADNKLKSILPRKANELQLAFSCASRDYTKDTFKNRIAIQNSKRRRRST